MRWILVDVVLALLTVALLALVALGLWRKVKALGRAVDIATAQLAAATASLDALNDRNRSFVEPTPAGHVVSGRQPTRGVRSSRSS